MGNPVVDWVFRRQKFCCCLPVRIGVIVMSFLTTLLAGLLMIVLWYELAVNTYMGDRGKTVLAVAGLVETSLFIVSALGFIGACARKQLFVNIFAIFLYFHLLLNIGIASYFLIMISRAANTDIARACEEGIRDQSTKEQCTDLIDFIRNAFFGVAIVVLAVEAYCALIVTRYVNQLRYEKRNVRSSRIIQRQRAFDAFHERFSTGGTYNSNRNSHFSNNGDKHELVQRDFNPYEHDAERAMTASPTLAGSIRSSNYDYHYKDGLKDSKRDSYQYSYLSDQEREGDTGRSGISPEMSSRAMGVDHHIPGGAMRPATPSLHSPDGERLKR